MNPSSRPSARIPAALFALSVAVASVSAQTPSAERGHGALLQRPGDIKVSGYWVLDVRNPDGSIATHTEFENALTPGGGGMLGQVLAGNGAVGTLVVEIDGPSNQRPCGSSCIIVPNVPFFNNVPLGSGGFRNLSITAQTAGEPRLVLSGLVTVTGGAIQTVRTLAIVGCLPAPAPCGFLGTGANGTFTEFTLAAPIPVAPGQVVNVTVTLSFSS